MNKQMKEWHEGQKKILKTNLEMKEGVIKKW